MLKHLALCASLCAGPLTASELNVVADIPPVHSLVAQVMGDLGSPALLTAPGTSAHGHALRPSEAARLQAADVLIWIGPELTPWLADAKAQMAQDAASLALIDAKGVRLLESRGAHHHTHEADEHAHNDSEHEHEHESEAQLDPHLWLAPENAILWLGLIADALAEHDTANAAAYRANAAAAAALEADIAAIEARMAKLPSREFLTAHDAFQYFEVRFDLTSHAALTASDDQAAGPAHLRSVLSTSEDIACLVTEPSTPDATTRLIVSTLGIKAVTLDPLGSTIPLGQDHYSALMVKLASGFEHCLTPED